MAIEEVTPEQAAEWLTWSRQGVRGYKVRGFVKDMDAGKWDANSRSRPVIVDERRKRLENGNHRLTAVVEHGKPVAMQVRRKT